MSACVVGVGEGCNADTAVALQQHTLVQAVPFQAAIAALGTADAWQVTDIHLQTPCEKHLETQSVRHPVCDMDMYKSIEWLLERI